MLKLNLYPHELRELIGYLRFNTDGQEQLPLLYQPLDVMLMLAYLEKWTPRQMMIWRYRRHDKEYALTVSAITVKAIYQHMGANFLTPDQQLLRDKLDLAIKNYRNPYAEAHVLGELIRLEGY